MLCRDNGHVFSRALTRGSIQTPVKVTTRSRISHASNKGIQNAQAQAHPILHRIQTRSVFSLLSNETEKLESKSDEVGKADISMPLRQIGTDLSDHHEETRIHRNNFNRVRKEVFELLDSPVGSFAWPQLPPLLHYLCENESTIHHAFALLDRASMEPAARKRITHEMVDQVVRQWLNAYISQQKHIDKPHSKSYYRRSNNRNGKHNRDCADHREKRSHRIPNPLHVWNKIQNYQQIGIPLESPTYHKIMEGTTHVKSKAYNVPYGARLAETILEEIMNQSKRKNPLIRPSAYAFTIAMLSWEQATVYSPAEANRDAPQRAMALLTKLKSLYASGWGNEFMPDKNAYRRVMNIFAHRGDGDQVEALLEDLYTMYLDHYEQGHENSGLLVPTTPFFSLVLYAWSKSRDPGAAERAEAILDHMLEMERSGEIPKLKIHSNFFNIVMVCWSKQRTIESAEKVQAIFDRLVQYSESDANKKPVGASYLALITTWSRFDPKKSEDFFWKWKEEHENGTCEMRIDSDLIRMLVSSWCKSEEPDAAERSERLIRFAIHEPDWKPSAEVFRIVINKWCQPRTLEGLERAEELLRLTISCHENNPSSHSKPTNLIYLPIIRSWAEIGQLERAEELLVDFFTQWRDNGVSNGLHSGARPLSDRQQHMDTRIFNCVLKGWLAKASSMPEAVIRAEDLLLLTRSYGVKPNYASFQYVLDAWRQHLSGFHHPFVSDPDRPRADAVLALLDQEFVREDAKNELYLNLRRGWKLLSVN